MMKVVVFGLFVALVLPSLAVGAKFDFDDKDALTTASGYTSVTRDSLYSSANGYGFVMGSGSPALTDHNDADWSVGYDMRCRDAVFTHTWNDYFRVDVDPTKDYYVSFAAGCPGWSTWNVAKIQGVWYGLNTDSPTASSGASHPGIVKVYDAYNGQLREFVAQNSSADPATTTAGEYRFGSYNAIKVFGYNNNSEYYNKGYYYNQQFRNEFFYLDKLLVTKDQLNYDATNGKYWIQILNSPDAYAGAGYIMAEVTAVPEPMTLATLAMGGLALIRRKK